MRDVQYVSKGATISADGKYRYRLWREWRLHPTPAQWDMWTHENGKPVLDGAGAQLGTPKSCVFIMLNPSTADGEADDPTIRRCVGFARALGYDRLDVVNLFASIRSVRTIGAMSARSCPGNVSRGTSSALGAAMGRT